MFSKTLKDWERVEAERSASEASHFDVADLIADEKQVRRYLDPSSNTPFPLEYSYYLLGDVRGKTVLEYGCGDGLNTIALAQRGAKVKALDISPDLIDIARQRLLVNNIDGDVEFIVGSAHDLPLPDESVDIVFGIAILHHLDLALSAGEVKRVLRKGGRAIFQEPIRNSKLIKFLRDLIPYQTPDVSPFERSLTNDELANYANGFSSYKTKAFNLPTTNLASILPPISHQFIDNFYKIDAAILQRVPWLNYYASIQVMELVK